MQNEMILFLSRKNKIILVCVFIGIFLLFGFYYAKNYQTYTQVYENQANENLKIATVWKSYYEGQSNASSVVIDAKKMSRFMESKLESLSEKDKRLLALFTDYEQYNIRLMHYLSNDASLEKVSRILVDMDMRIREDDELKDDISITGIYKKDYETWQARCYLHDIHKQLNIYETNWFRIPTGFFMLYAMFNKDSFLFLILISAVVLFSFDCWAKEYEQGTIFNIRTYPVAFFKTYFGRFLANLICVFIFVLVVAIGLFIVGTVKYGVGGEYLFVCKDGVGFVYKNIDQVVLQEVIDFIIIIILIMAGEFFTSILLCNKMNCLLIWTIILLMFYFTNDTLGVEDSFIYVANSYRIVGLVLANIFLVTGYFIFVNKEA